MKINPLMLIFGVSAPLELTIGDERVKLIVHFSPLRLRTVLALMAKAKLQPPTAGGKLHINIPSDFVFKSIIKDGIKSIYTIEGEELNVETLNPLLQQRLVNLILTLNGLTNEGQAILHEELEKLKQHLLQNLRQKGKQTTLSNSDLDEIAFVANLAYSALSAGVNISAPTLLDEPYILILLALTAARAEREYLDEQSASIRTHSTATPDTIQIFAEDEMPPLHSLIPKHPVPSSDVRDTMLRIAEALSGVSFHVEEG